MQILWPGSGAEPEGRGSPAEIPWTYEDEALHYTAVVLDSRKRGAALEPALHTFPLDDPDEFMVASGPYRRDYFGPAGDGTYLAHAYHHRDTLLAMSAKALSNSRQRRVARDETAHRWLPLDEGTFYVSTRSLYFESWSAVREWSFGGIEAACMTARSRFRFIGVSDLGDEVHWLVTSAWAELAFALWALNRAVPHPHLLSLFPDEWRDRARARGLVLPPLDP
jgi:hypothetical protein